MAWLPRKRRLHYDAPAGVAESPRRRSATNLLLSYAQRYGAARGLYRVFNAAAYRFYRSNVAPPTTADAPFATSATLPSTPATTFADGTWYLSMSYFNGVLDSGFLPLGPRGETYLKIVIAGGVAQGAKPGQPYNARLVALAAGVVQVLAFYAPVADGANAATQWAIAYTIDGSIPPTGAPTITKAMGTGAIQVLSYKLPAQANGTIVKVQLQMRRGTVYSDPLDVLQATANTAGPSAPLSLGTWPGTLPEVSP